MTFTDCEFEGGHRTLGLAVTRVPGAGCIVLDTESGLSHVLNANACELLQLCATSRTLDGHAFAVARFRHLRGLSHLVRTRNGPLQTLLAKLHIWVASQDIVTAPEKVETDNVRKQLRELAKCGLLKQDSHIRARLRGNGDIAETTPDLVPIIAIPTRNRPSSLRRLLNSIVEKGESTTSIIVAEDSIYGEDGGATRALVDAVAREHSVDAVCVDRVEREEFASRLAQDIGVDHEIVRFGLLGDVTLGRTYGATRNTLQLLCAGGASIQPDDDMVWDVFQSKDPTRNRQSEVCVVSGSVASDFEFFLTRLECMSSLIPVQHRLTDLHSRLLGKYVSEYLPPTTEIGFVTDDLYRRATLANARVAVTSIGVAGASGMEDSAYRLFLTGESHKRLVFTLDGFEDKLKTDYLVRAPRKWTMSDGASLMAAGTGFDLRDVLPPFPPMFRNEEGVFSAALRFCSPELLQGLIPYCVMHDPPEVRQSHHLQSTPWRTNDLLSLIIARGGSWPTVTPCEAAYHKLSAFLADLAAPDRPHLAELVHEIIRESVAQLVMLIYRRLDEEGGAPDYWASQLIRYKDALLVAAEDPLYYLPGDLPGDAADRLEHFRVFVGRYASLVGCWPYLFSSAKRQLAGARTLSDVVQARATN